MGGGSGEEAGKRLKDFFSPHKIVVKGIVLAVAHEAGEVANDKKALEEARGLGEKLAAEKA